jgi:hypothetical protein
MVSERISYGEWNEPNPDSEVYKLVAADIIKATDSHGGVSPIRWFVDRPTFLALAGGSPEPTKINIVAGVPIFLASDGTLTGAALKP